MPIYITQGRYTREAVKGMIVKPEDRADAVSRLLGKAGGRLLGYYLTFGEYDFIAIVEVASDPQAAAALLAAALGRRDGSEDHGGDDLGRGQGRLRGGERSGARLQVGGRCVSGP